MIYLFLVSLFICTSWQTCDEGGSDKCSGNSKEEGCGCKVSRDSSKHSTNEQNVGAEQQTPSFSVDLPRTNEMVYIERGTFTMGTNEPVFPVDGENPARKVTVDSFYLDKHEVSNAEFQRFVEDTNYVTEVNMYVPVYPARYSVCKVCQCQQGCFCCTICSLYYVLCFGIYFSIFSRIHLFTDLLSFLTHLS